MFGTRQEKQSEKARRKRRGFRLNGRIRLGRGDVRTFQYFFLNSSNTGQTTVWIQRRFEFLMILNFIIYGILDARAWENILTGETVFLPEPRRFNHYE